MTNVSQTDYPDFDPFGPMTFTRVYRLPAKLTDGFAFGGGRPISFQNVDWFETPLHFERSHVEQSIRGKKYFDPDAAFLVLSDDPKFTFVIGEVKR